MTAKRKSKTAQQQSRYYEVDNIFEYMVETYLNGNIKNALLLKKKKQDD